MPAPEDTRASAQADLDIGALYARLQHEVARTTGTEGAWAELRDLAERYRAIGARGSRSPNEDREAGNGEADNQAESDEQCGFHDASLRDSHWVYSEPRQQQGILDRNKERTH